MHRMYIPESVYFIANFKCSSSFHVNSLLLVRGVTLCWPEPREDSGKYLNARWETVVYIQFGDVT